MQPAGPALPGLPDCRARWSPQSAGSPTTGSTSTRTKVRVGRVQNFGSWSPELVKDGRTCLGLEYFVFEGDELWSMTDDDLVALGTAELVTLGLVRAERRREGLRGQDGEGLPRLRRGLRPAGGGDPGMARGRGAERSPRRPQRHAPLQQPGPLDDDRDADGREPLRGAVRHLGGERRIGVPRGAAREAPGPAGARSGATDTGRSAPVLPARS